jgi:small subunit ribosomal protein S11
MAKKQGKQTKKRKVRIDALGQAHIGSSFNNIIISLTNQQGQVISCGRVALEAGLKKVKAYVKGPGNGRESAIRSLHNLGIEVVEIIDITPIPHNGCRAPKKRRV